MMEERNKSAAFGTGTFPPTIDLKQMARIEQWLLDKEPPKYPFRDQRATQRAGRKTLRAILRAIATGATVGISTASTSAT